MTTPLPADTVGLMGLIIVTVGGWVTAIINGWLHRREVKTIRGDVGEVKEQVQNSHKTNLRDDIDKTRRAVESVAAQVGLIDQKLTDLHSYTTSQAHDITGIRQDVGSLRGEVRKERQYRIEFERAVREAYRAAHPEADPI